MKENLEKEVLLNKNQEYYCTLVSICMVSLVLNQCLVMTNQMGLTKPHFKQGYY